MIQIGYKDEICYNNSPIESPHDCLQARCTFYEGVNRHEQVDGSPDCECLLRFRECDSTEK